MLQPVKVGLLGGTGAEGRGLALRFAAAGVRVALGSRQRERALEASQAINQSLDGRLGIEPVSFGLNTEVAAQSKIVFLTVPYAHAVETLKDCWQVFQSDSVLVDVTVPLVFETKKVRLLLFPEGSGSRSLANYVPAGVELVAAFKTIPAHLLAQPDRALDCDVLVCGDSPAARRTVMDLIGLLPGVRAVDAGDLDSAAALEHMCLLAVGINRRYKVKESRFRIVGL